jgi:hypothetical protein
MLGFAVPGAEGSIPSEMDRTLGRGPTAQLLAPAEAGRHGGWSISWELTDGLRQ